jgi:hypothetical protein
MEIIVPIRIELFEFIYFHKHLLDSLREFMETTYDMFIS